MSRPLRWLGNLALVLTGLLVALVLTEIAVRVISPQLTGITYQDRYGLAIHWPGLTRYLPQYGHTISFNSVGMRDREHQSGKPAGVFRILVLGDSFMEANQVPFEKSLPGLLGEELGERYPKRIEVINAAVAGWGTDDELRYLESYGMNWKPDLVLVVMTLHNDISDNLRQEWHALRNGALVDVPHEPFSAFRYSVITLKAWMASRFQLYQIWRRVRHGAEMQQAGRVLNSHVADLFRIQPTPQISRGLLLTEHLLERMQREVAEGGGRTAVILLPLQVQLSDEAFTEFAKTTGHPDSLAIETPQRLVSAITSTLRIPVLDLLPAFRAWTAEGRTSPYLVGDGHWNEAGHRLASEVTRPFVEQFLPR